MLPLIVRLAQGPWVRRIRVILPDCEGRRNTSVRQRQELIRLCGYQSGYELSLSIEPRLSLP